MRNRRGLSTVIGAVFFVIAATTIITYISYSMNSIDEFAQSVIVSEAQNINRGMEKITIAQTTIDGGKFNMTVVNTGSLPVKLTRLWVVDEDTGLNSKADLVDVIINPGKQQYNIGQNSGMSAVSTGNYTLKAVTDRGNIATFSVSPNTSTQIQLIIPGEVQPGENFRVVTLITNNSTLPNNIVDLVPIIKNNSTLTQIDGPLPPSIKTLPQGNTATFTSTYVAPSIISGILFNATYAGAPASALVNSNMTVALSAESEEATNSQWSQAASRVGILISGIPNPLSSANAEQYSKWGIGIINPLDRDVEVYAVGVRFSANPFIQTINGVEPVTGTWRIADTGNSEMAVWEGGNTPVTISPKSVGQFRMELDFKQTNEPASELLLIIQALSSEGKLSAFYTASASTAHPMINAFYSTDNSTKAAALSSWTYIIEAIPSQKNDQLFNATIYNSATPILYSPVKLIILVPSDFTDVKDLGTIANGWKPAMVFKNPDNSHVITVESDGITLAPNAALQYQFSADAPLVTEDKLYVLQTTTVYPTFTSGAQVELASALSEAGIEVVP